MKIETLKTKYEKIVVPEMKKQFGYANMFEVPQIKKVVINTGIGKIAKEQDKIDEVIRGLTDIAGQKPVKNKALKAISGFKMREGQEVGVMVTLRGKRMWQFVDRLVNISLARTRDFQGINKSAVDQSGNINIGIREHIIFPEIVPEKVKHVFGFQVNIITTATSQEQGLALFRLLGFPIKQ